MQRRVSPDQLFEEVNGLVAEVGYRFRVRAVNTVGAAEWSPPSAPSVPKSRISTIGIIIGDKDERPFMLQVDSIVGYVRDTSL